MLPTPEKNLLSEKIGFRYDTDDNRQLIGSKNFKHIVKAFNILYFVCFRTQNEYTYW